MAALMKGQRGGLGHQVHSRLSRFASRIWSVFKTALVNQWRLILTIICATAVAMLAILSLASSPTTAIIMVAGLPPADDSREAAIDDIRRRAAGQGVSLIVFVSSLDQAQSGAAVGVAPTPGLPAVGGPNAGVPPKSPAKPAAPTNIATTELAAPVPTPAASSASATAEPFPTMTDDLPGYLLIAEPQTADQVIDALPPDVTVVSVSGRELRPGAPSRKGTVFLAVQAGLMLACLLLIARAGSRHQPSAVGDARPTLSGHPDVQYREPATDQPQAAHEPVSPELEEMRPADPPPPPRPRAEATQYLRAGADIFRAHTFRPTTVSWPPPQCPECGDLEGQYEAGSYACHACGQHKQVTSEQSWPDVVIRPRSRNIVNNHPQRGAAHDI
jgi:hypothetical protein